MHLSCHYATIAYSGDCMAHGNVHSEQIQHTPGNLNHPAAFTHLCDLFLESEGESGAPKGKRPGFVGYVLKPLNDEGGWDVEREIPYDVKVGWICGATHTHILSSLDSLRGASQLEKWHYPTFLPWLRDSCWKTSVHPVGENVTVDNPQPPWCCLRQQLWE